MITELTMNWTVEDPLMNGYEHIETSKVWGDLVAMKLPRALSMIRSGRACALFLMCDDGTMTRVVKEGDGYVMRHYTVPQTESWDREDAMDSAAMGRAVRNLLK